MPGKLREEWRSDLQTVVDVRDAANRDLADALSEFADKLGGGSRGHWRRWFAIALLLTGVALQAAGGAWALLL